MVFRVRRRFPEMKRLVLLVVSCLVLALPGLTLAQDDASAVAVGETDELGQFLTDAEGMTLYLFTRDEPGKSNCYDECAVNWPPLLSDNTTLPEGVAGELTVVARDDGTEMLAYNGWPLYYWINDEAPGDTTGHLVGDVWFVVELGDETTPPAVPMEEPAASPAASPVAAGEGQSVDVSLVDFAIEMPAEVAAGTVTFNITNDGQAPHNFEIEGNGVEMELEENLEPGESGTLEVDLAPGTYEVYCPVGNHADQGMRLELTVTE
jgi:predicted lipoprotein with Yx(FWY)xxD motif